jgi:hypothetical protein
VTTPSSRPKVPLSASATAEAIEHKHRIEGYVTSERYVITAAHCLPRMPVLHGEPGWDGWDTTYQKLLAPLDGEPAVWADCVFVDPVGDIAVLGPPDNQAFYEQDDAYCELVEAVMPLKIAALGKEGWLLSLDGVWFRCGIEMYGGPVLALATWKATSWAGCPARQSSRPKGRPSAWRVSARKTGRATRAKE